MFRFYQKAPNGVWGRNVGKNHLLPGDFEKPTKVHFLIRKFYAVKGWVDLLLNFDILSILDKK